MKPKLIGKYEDSFAGPTDVFLDLELDRIILEGPRRSRSIFALSEVVERGKVYKYNNWRDIWKLVDRFQRTKFGKLAARVRAYQRKQCQK